MATSTAVNDQITDAVTQTNVKVIAESPAFAVSNLYQAVSNSLATSIQNATFAQQQSNLIHQATTSQGVNLLYAMDTEAIADGATKISRADIPDNAINEVMISSLMKNPPLVENLPQHLKAAYEQFAKRKSS